MSHQWQYQLRINLGDEFAELARRDPDDPAFEPLAEVLSKHRATMKCQFEALSDKKRVALHNPTIGRFQAAS